MSGRDLMNGLGADDAEYLLNLKPELYQQFYKSLYRPLQVEVFEITHWDTQKECKHKALSTYRV